MEKKNKFEYIRGLIVASILWFGFTMFLILVDLIRDLIQWGLGYGLAYLLIFVSFVIVSAMLLVRIGERAWIKLTKNRFKYFSTENIKKALESKEAVSDEMEKL